LLALLDKCNNSDWKAEDAQGRTPGQVALQNNHKTVGTFLRSYTRITSSYDWLGWVLLPPFIIIMMGIAPTYPWFALGAVLVLGLFFVTPWRSHLFNEDKAYYLFLGLVGFSLVVNIKQSGDYLGKPPRSTDKNLL